MANQNLYGFETLESLGDRRIATVGIPEIDNAIQLAVTEHNSQLDALLSLFCERTTDYSALYLASSAGRLQAGNELSRARPVLPTGRYQVAFPLRQGDTALGWTYQSGFEKTAAEFARDAAAILIADTRWMRDHLLAALFANVSYTFTDPKRGALTVQGLANADSQTYEIVSGGDAEATDQHYLAQAAAIADASNPFPGIFTELTEHAENGGFTGKVVAMVPSSNVAAVQALANFYPVADGNINPGSGAATLTGSLGVPVPGRVFGYVDRVWVSEWAGLPANYLIATTTTADKALKLREPEAQQLRGFHLAGTRDDYPYIERQFKRIAGFGGNNRVGAVVQRVGNGSYAVPTGYTEPMP